MRRDVFMQEDGRGAIPKVRGCMRLFGRSAKRLFRTSAILVFLRRRTSDNRVESSHLVFFLALTVF